MPFQREGDIAHEPLAKVTLEEFGPIFADLDVEVLQKVLVRLCCWVNELRALRRRHGSVLTWED